MVPFPLSSLGMGGSSLPSFLGAPGCTSHNIVRVSLTCGIPNVESSCGVFNSQGCLIQSPAIGQSWFRFPALGVCSGNHNTPYSLVLESWRQWFVMCFPRVLAPVRGVNFQSVHFILCRKDWRFQTSLHTEKEKPDSINPCTSSVSHAGHHS